MFFQKKEKIQLNPKIDFHVGVSELHVLIRIYIKIQPLLWFSYI